MTTLADKAILSGADNRPPMLEKDMYDSWKNRMELYMMNRQYGRMIIESVENGPHIWPTIEENRVTRPKKYSDPSVAKATKADCDVKATNIILQGLSLKSSQYGLPYQSSTPLSITYPSNDYQSLVHHNVYSPPSSIPQMEYAPIVTQQQYEFPQLDSGLTVLVFKQDPGIPEGQATQTIITYNAAYQANDLDTFDSDCDELNTAKVGLMANLS
nr:hypothetical protein [Tanacetum cinerariifolium]